jgi:hypothetical protein
MVQFLSISFWQIKLLMHIKFLYMNKLLQDSWEILKKNPNLYTPPALLLLLGGLVNPAEASVSPFFIVSVITFIFINIAVTAGWLNEIKVVIVSREQKASFDDVLVGIGKYFGVILVGSFILFSLLITFLSVHLTAASSMIGMTQENISAFQKIWQTIRTLKQEELEAYVTKIDPSLLLIAYKWVFAVISYLCLAGIFYFFISLWTQCCVFRGVSWFQGWRRSFKLVTKNLGIYTVLTLIQSMVIFMLFMLTLLLSDIFTQILLTVISVITKTYFAVLFCLFIVRFDDDNRIELLKDEVHAPISEIQGPDSKK